MESLWHYMFRSPVRNSIQSGSGPVNIWYIQRIFRTVTIEILNLEYIVNKPLRGCIISVDYKKDSHPGSP